MICSNQPVWSCDDVWFVVGFHCTGNVAPCRSPNLPYSETHCPRAGKNPEQWILRNLESTVLQELQGLEHHIQVLVVRSLECGFESRSWHLCLWARCFTLSASLSPRGKWVPERADMVLCDCLSWEAPICCTGCMLPRELRQFKEWIKWPSDQGS